MRQGDYMAAASREPNDELYSVRLVHDVARPSSVQSRWQGLGLTSAVGMVALMGTSVAVWAVSVPRPVPAAEHAPFLGLAAVHGPGRARAAHADGARSDDDRHAVVVHDASDGKDEAEDDKDRKCSVYGENCWITRCCHKEGQRCYMKDGAWAGCLDACEMGLHADDPEAVRTPWTCFHVLESGPAEPPPNYSPKPVADEPALPGPPTKPAGAADGEFPTLFCFAVIRSGTYELDLIKKQFALKASYFACEDWAILSDVEVELAPGIRTIELGSLETHDGVRTHFANTDIFSRAFDKLKVEGRMMGRDFVVKLDPDAVFFPDRLKAAIRNQAHAPAVGDTGPNMYFQNCLFQNRLWMFGAIEVLSQEALKRYFGGRDTVCKSALDYYNMGEDTFLARCLDRLGVQAVKDFSLLSDGYCDEAPGACNTNQVTYHPFKDPMSWEACFRSATR